MSMLYEVVKLYQERADFFIELLCQHVILSTLAIVLISMIGITIGIYITRHKKLASTVLGVTNFLYTIPSIALFGFLVAITGIGNVTALIALVIYGLMPMIKNTYTGINEVDGQVVDSAIAMGSTDWQLLYRIQLPMAIPMIMTGFRTMVVMTIALTGIASFIGAGGLGVAIWRGITTNYSAMTIAGSLLVALLSVLVDWWIGKLDKRMSNWVNGIRKKKRGKKWTIFLGIMLAIICAVGVGIIGGFGQQEKIVVASKPHTEQYILAEMICQLIEENTELKVERQFGIGGGTSNIHPAMLKGEIDIYPEYTGTAWLFVLKKDMISSPEGLHEAVKEAYLEEYNLRWLGVYGLNNTFTLALKREVAEELGVNTYSELAAVSEKLSIGCEYDFYEREDGYPGLEKTYGFAFKDKKDIDIGLKYEAIGSNQVDVINAGSTDALIKTYDLKILEDDKQFFPPYQVATVIRQETLERYPELEEVLNVLEGQISDEEIIELNYQVEEEKREPKEVARDFLTLKGLIEER